MLEQSMQVEALRLLAAWWDSSRPGTTVTDALALPSGYRPARRDERLAEVS